jgi:hypothetical protein
MIKSYLEAPKEYWSTPTEIVDQLTGGCGPGELGDYLVPDSFLGLSIYPACRIHDFMYWWGYNQKYCDDLFLKNMKAIIKHESCTLIKPIRYAMAGFYYRKVRKYGEKFYNS